jgi:hypothetical protein
VRHIDHAQRDGAAFDLRQINGGREESTHLLEGCDHNYPIVVGATKEGKYAQCLGCYKVGPTREDSQSARHALLLTTRGSDVCSGK